MFIVVVSNSMVNFIEQVLVYGTIAKALETMQLRCSKKKKQLRKQFMRNESAWDIKYVDERNIRLGVYYRIPFICI